MCGRFTLLAPVEEICQQFEVFDPLPLLPRYNIAPTQEIVAVRGIGESKERELTHLRWGLIPSWSKDPSIANKLLNARGETLAEKPSFRSALKSRRCLIVADGFFEWRKEGKKKIPLYFRLNGNRIFAFAGLWERWSLHQEKPVETCTIITTEANDLLRPIHDRMPVIIPSENYGDWLASGPLSAQSLASFLVPYPSSEMTVKEVSSRVNSPRNDDPACIEAEPTLGF